MAALLLARADGAQVIAVTRREQYRTRLQAIGATAVVVSGDSSDWPDDVRGLTGGEGADVAMDVIGGLSLGRSIAATRMGGTVHLVGYAADMSAKFDIFDAIRHAATIRVAVAGSRRSFVSLDSERPSWISRKVAISASSC
jgi:threonine dehydrogenase-like Zn-dependent dehydrogenase